MLVQHPSKIMEHAALDVSAGMPTSQGNQYFSMSRLAHHVPRVDEQGHAELLASFVERRESWIAQVESVHVGPI